MIAGGSEASSPTVIGEGMAGTAILAPGRPDNPSATCRPFSRDRNGTVIGEGVAFVILEDYSRAISRGARISAEARGLWRHQ